MKHEKTFEAINKLRDIEVELHRLKNALELANKMLDAQRTWVGLTREEAKEICLANRPYVVDMVIALEAELKKRNGFTDEGNT